MVSMDTQNKRQNLISVLTIAVITALCVLLFFTNAFGELESYAEDSIYQRGEPIPSDIKIISQVGAEVIAGSSSKPSSFTICP